MKTFTGEADAFPELKNGSLTAIMAAPPTLRQAIKSGEPFALSGKPLFYQGLSFGVRKGQPDLLAVLDYAIRTMRSDGTLSRLSKEWFDGLDLEPEGQREGHAGSVAERSRVVAARGGVRVQDAPPLAAFTLAVLTRRSA